MRRRTQHRRPRRLRRHRRCCQRAPRIKTVPFHSITAASTGWRRPMAGCSRCTRTERVSIGSRHQAVGCSFQRQGILPGCPRPFRTSRVRQVLGAARSPRGKCRNGIHLRRWQAPTRDQVPRRVMIRTRSRPTRNPQVLDNRRHSRTGRMRTIMSPRALPSWSTCSPRQPRGPETGAAGRRPTRGMVTRVVETLTDIGAPPQSGRCSARHAADVYERGGDMIRRSSAAR